MTLSVSLYLFAMQALLPQFLTPCIQLFLFLFGQIPFAICDLFFHIAGMGVYQRVQHDLRRVQQKDTVPFLAVRLPSQQRIAVTGRYDFIQRVLPENIVKDLQNPIKAQHLIRPPHRKSIQTISFPQPVLSMCSSGLPIAFDLRLLTLHPRLRLPSTVA